MNRKARRLRKLAFKRSPFSKEWPAFHQRRASCLIDSLLIQLDSLAAQVAALEGQRPAARSNESKSKPDAASAAAEQASARKQTTAKDSAG